MIVLTEILRILVWFSVVVMTIGGGAFGVFYGHGRCSNFEPSCVTQWSWGFVGLIGGFALAALIFGTLALLFDIRDILHEIREQSKKQTQPSPIAPVAPVAPTLSPKIATREDYYAHTDKEGKGSS